MIDEKPRDGADGYRIAFLHPKSTNGVLVEISEKK
jgi:methylmalonyl-CoA/ethylmalonyl-CoA epimerase